MAFFNLTYLGPQDPIKVTCETSGSTSPNAKKVEATVSSRTSSTNKSEEDRSVDKGDELPRARHDGSYVKYTQTWCVSTLEIHVVRIKLKVAIYTSASVQYPGTLKL